MLALSAIRNNDRVGALLFTDRIEHVVPPREGAAPRAAPHPRRARARARGRGTDIAGGARLSREDAAAPRDHLPRLRLRGAGPRAAAQAPRAAARRGGGHGRRSARARRCPTSGSRASPIPRAATSVDVDTSDPRVRDALSPRRSRRSASARTQLLRRLAIDEVPVRTDEQLRRAAAALLPRARDAARAGDERASRRLVVVLAIRASALGGGAGTRRAAASRRARRSREAVSVAPETVTVGEPFAVTMRVRAPPGAHDRISRRARHAVAVRGGRSAASSSRRRLTPASSTHARLPARRRGTSGASPSRSATWWCVGRRRPPRSALDDASARSWRACCPRTRALRVPKPCARCSSRAAAPLVVDTPFARARVAAHRARAPAWRRGAVAARPPRVATPLRRSRAERAFARIERARPARGGRAGPLRGAHVGCAARLSRGPRSRSSSLRADHERIRSALYATCAGAAATACEPCSPTWIRSSSRTAPVQRERARGARVEIKATRPACR